MEMGQSPSLPFSPLPITDATSQSSREPTPWFDITQSFSPAIHNVQNTLTFRLTNPDGDLPPVPRILTQYMDPPRNLVESAEEAKAAAVKAFKISAGSLAFSFLTLAIEN